MHSPGRGPLTPSSAPPLYLLPANPPYLLPTNPSSLMDADMSNGASAPDVLALQLQESLRISNPALSAPLAYPHFSPQLPRPTPPGFTAQVLVPDTLIGSILGRGGRNLNELQMHSNTRIRISQRGEYAPGTRNRIVTIQGPTAHSVSLAQYLMSQHMVLPPTATYSPQAQYQPNQLQPRPAQHHHPSPQHHAYRQDFNRSQYQSGPDTVFSSGEVPEYSSSAPASRSPSRSNSGID
jgi:hypothetical protein